MQGWNCESLASVLKPSRLKPSIENILIYITKRRVILWINFGVQLEYLHEPTCSNVVLRKKPCGKWVGDLANRIAGFFSICKKLVQTFPWQKNWVWSGPMDWTSPRMVTVSTPHRMDILLILTLGM